MDIWLSVKGRSYNEWQRVRHVPSLERGDVDLWRVDIDRDDIGMASMLQCLSTDEKDRANRFVFPRDRHRFIAGRATLRKILGSYLDVSPEKIPISARKFGKPYLSAEDSTLRFNVSHSNGTAVIAVSQDREVGVDIEYVNKEFDIFSVAPSAFSAAEVARLRSLSIREQADAFFFGWTRKEAILKAFGDGLSSSEELQSAVSNTSLDDGQFRWTIDGAPVAWSVTSFDVGSEFKTGLAVEGNLGQVSIFELT